MWFLTNYVAYLSALAAIVTLRDSADLLSCLENRGVSFIKPGSETFESASLAINTRFLYTPAAIVYPDSARELSSAVKCAGLKTPVVARSGGHSYGAFGLGGQDGALVVDLARMKAITVNPDNTATIQTGNKLGDVALTLFERGGRAMPHGTCPNVGIGGHTGCGGFGLSSRMWGLVADQPLSAEVVLADGSIVTASETGNSDLFWAIRGAAPSFGFVTEYTMKTYEAPSSNIVFAYPYVVNASTATSIFHAFQTFGRSSAPPELGLQLYINQTSQDNSVSLTLRGVFYGSKARFHDTLHPLLDMVPRSQAPKDTQLDWIDSLIELGEIGTLNTSLHSVGSNAFFAKSLMVPQDAPLTLPAIRSLFDYIVANGSSTNLKWFIIVNLFGGEGSKINNIPHNSTSYAHRNGFYNLQMRAASCNPKQPFPDEGMSFVNDMFSSITTKMPSNWKFGAFPCYTDPTLSPPQWQSQYYGENYARLSLIHEKYNPCNILRNPQSIKSSSSTCKHKLS